MLTSSSRGAGPSEGPDVDRRVSLALPIVDDVEGAGFADWRWQLRHRITGKEEIAARLPLTDEESAGLDAAPGRFRVAVTPYYFSLIDRDHPACPVRMQVIPRAEELENEPRRSRRSARRGRPLAGHRRSSTAIPTACCCWRSIAARSTAATATAAAWSARRRRRSRAATSTARSTTSAARRPSATCSSRAAIRSRCRPTRLEWIVAALRAIPHVEIIRIGTRVPVVLPMRVDDELCAMLRKYHPLYINTHFNHPKELTPRARAACEKLADAGIPLGNQTVLLRGVNSSVRGAAQAVHRAPAMPRHARTTCSRATSPRAPRTCAPRSRPASRSCSSCAAASRVWPSRTW